MPLPLLALGLGLAAASGIVTVSQMVRTKQWQKEYQKAYDHAVETQHQLQLQAAEFNRQAEDYGLAKVQASGDLQRAVEFLKKAQLKDRDYQAPTAHPEDRQARIEEFDLQVQTLQAVLRTASGPAAAAAAAGAPAGLYAAVGLFGTASTGTAISSLSGAAFHNAVMAAIGRLAGGAGMAAGSTALTAISVGLNIVSLPISLGAAYWSIKKGNEAKAQVQKELTKIAAAITAMAEQSAVMEVVQRQMSIGKQAIQSARYSLSQALLQNDPENPEEAHAVYKLADVLAHAIDAQTLTPRQAEILGIEIKTDPR